MPLHDSTFLRSKFSRDCLIKGSFVQAELEETVREAERKEEELERLRDERDTIQG